MPSGEPTASVIVSLDRALCGNDWIAAQPEKKKLADTTKHIDRAGILRTNWFNFANTTISFVYDVYSLHRYHNIPLNCNLILFLFAIKINRAHVRYAPDFLNELFCLIAIISM